MERFPKEPGAKPGSCSLRLEPPSLLLRAATFPDCPASALEVEEVEEEREGGEELDWLAGLCECSLSCRRSSATREEEVSCAPPALAVAESSPELWELCVPKRLASSATDPLLLCLSSPASPDRACLEEGVAVLNAWPTVLPDLSPTALVAVPLDVDSLLPLRDK